VLIFQQHLEVQEVAEVILTAQAEQELRGKEMLEVTVFLTAIHPILVLAAAAQGELE
jgi:hypothetical protein